ncbi:MAG: oxidoreductase, partial [Acidobacteriota bacterium]|nr:oxidoreductase [Acidobacteriota bacterium]
MSKLEGSAAGVEESVTGAAEASKYTRNNPYLSTVTANHLLTAEDSEKETRHLAFALDESMKYTPGDSLGVLPENRAQMVAEILDALGFTGDERVLDHYKVEISFEEALRTRLTLGKLARGAIGQYAKLKGAAGVGGRGFDALKALCGPENKAKAEEYCWGREFIDLLTDFPGAVQEPQELFNVLQRLVPRLYSIASSQLVHPDVAETSVRVVRYDTHGRGRLGVASGQL